jgi:hypothetical protein
MDQSPGTQIAAAASRTTIHPAAVKRASREPQTMSAQSTQSQPTNLACCKRYPTRV